MVNLDFVLSPEAAVRVHDALACLAKFNEYVFVEARADKLSLTALNPSKSAYASFSLDRRKFFLAYDFSRGQGREPDGRFSCSIANKALASVFNKRRLSDGRGRETAIERCEVSVLDNPKASECRLVVKMVCEQGVVKTYKLTYESAEVVHALFDKNAAKNRWTARSSMLQEIIEYFGPRTEQLDLYYAEGRVTFTSFVEKITNGKEILKQPLQTSVSVEKEDFDSFDAEDKVHIITSVKDFKAVVVHASTMRATISTYYSNPTKPLQFSYGDDAMKCEFTLMTHGDFRANPSVDASHTVTNRSISTTQSNAQVQVNQRRSFSEIEPRTVQPARQPRRRKVPGSAPRPAETSQAQPHHEESLFVTQDEDDHRWDPVDTGHAGDYEDVLGWDASGVDTLSHPATFRDSGTASKRPAQDDLEGLPPTQRLSQVRGGLFD
ncbi:Rad9-domain-containing protein [Lineolata rhizophorae]|uniref:DNA repair protein rad9 n=1 Tax=Lineolata rhizophorae TaxID=578093 RepID=A0A6A6P216_9PEZI|nr:Rad9-domain-containing protein [Lineolata rhizophorae]